MNDDSLRQHQTHIEMESHPVPVTVFYRIQFGEVGIKHIRTEGGYSVSPERPEMDRIIGEINETEGAPV